MKYYWDMKLSFIITKHYIEAHRNMQITNNIDIKTNIYNTVAILILL